MVVHFIIMGSWQVADKWGHLLAGSVGTVQAPIHVHQNPAACLVNAVRVYVNSSSENLDYPVLVVVRQQKGVLSWQVPLLFQGLYQRSYNYQEVSRTLCPSEATNETGPLEQLVIVDVASMAPLGAQYKLLVTKITHFQLHAQCMISTTMWNLMVSISP